MIGMRTTPEQDLQTLQPAMQAQMPQPTMPLPPDVQQRLNNDPTHGWGRVDTGQRSLGQNFPGTGMPMTDQRVPNPLPQPQMETKGSIVKKAVKKAGGTTQKNSGDKTPGVMKWLMDYLNKRHESSLNHEREVLKSILEEQRARVDSGGSPVPDSLKGHEQEYFDNVRNTGNLR